MVKNLEKDILLPLINQDLINIELNSAEDLITNVLNQENENIDDFLANKKIRLNEEKLKKIIEIFNLYLPKI